MVLTEAELRRMISEALSEARRRKRKKKKKDSSKQKSIKALMLDKPFTTGGWPQGKDRGWLPNSKPVNVQVKDYLDDLGMLEESVLSATTLAALFSGCAGQDYDLTPISKKNNAGIDIPDCITDVRYTPRWDNPAWKQENNQDGIRNALGKVPFEDFKKQFESGDNDIRVQEKSLGSNNVPVLQVDWPYVPKSCPYFGSSGPTKGTSDELRLSDEEVDDIFAADEEGSINLEDRENFLVRISLSFPIFEIDGNKFVAEPIQLSTIPVANSSKCSQAYAKW